VKTIEFSDGEYLGISIEARLRADQVYNPLVGLFRQYTKIYVAATEQDVIGRRSHLRGENVLLYPVSATRAEMEQLSRANHPGLPLTNHQPPRHRLAS
jgi:hypothetical protein